MKEYLGIPLWFLFAGSVMGVLLRMQLVLPQSFIHYGNLLHGHSHIMFLGWVFNALYLAFVVTHIHVSKQQCFKVLFIIQQVLTLAMMISFPLQGYGACSIAFSTLHTFVSFAFIILFIKHAGDSQGLSLWFVKLSLLFLFVSSFGPFALAVIMAKGLSHTHWYQYAIYFYLHFQYNGFFLFGVLSLLATNFEATKTAILVPLKKMGIMLGIATVPTYFLSTLYSSPGLTFNVISGAGAILQLLAIAPIVQYVLRYKQQVVMSINHIHLPYAVSISVAFILKLILQLLSAIPAVATMAYEFRPIIVAYLHLVLVGIISMSILLWYAASGRITYRFMPFMMVFLLSFILMEFILIAMPWSTNVFPDWLSATKSLLFVSIILSFSCLIFALSYKIIRVDKSGDCLKFNQ